MVLPLAPLNLTSSILMPPAVWVKWASRPPARIRTTPSIANNHLPRMDASLDSLAVEPAFGIVCSFALLVIVSQSESRTRASGDAGSILFEALSERSERLLSRAAGFSNSIRHPKRAMLAILNCPRASRRSKLFRGLNQLQKLNQKVNLRMSGSGTDTTKSGWLL